MIARSYPSGLHVTMRIIGVATVAGAFLDHVRETPSSPPLLDQNGSHVREQSMVRARGMCTSGLSTL
jgi:hypothetical protein